MKFGILAAGNIANSMAKAVTGIEKAGMAKIEKYAVASRELSRAENFAKKWDFEKAYGSSMWRRPIPTTMPMQGFA